MTDPAQPNDTSSAPIADSVAAQTDERPRQHKRTRAAMDPGTPKGEEGEPKGGLMSSTPVAKKGRVEGDEDEVEGTSPSDSGHTTPPTASNAPLSTPGPSSGTRKPPGTEGKETKSIRERVAAMKATSTPSHPSQTPAQAQGQAQGQGSDREMQVAETAAEVSVSAAKLGDEEERKEEKDVEIAEVAAEVGKSAELVNDRESGPMRTDEAKVAGEVSQSAEKVQKEDQEIADTAAETAEVAQEVPERPVSESTSFVPYTGGSTPAPAPSAPTTSSFSAFSSTSSPFASVSTPAKPSPLSADAQKPKTKSSFSASPFLSSSIPLAKKPDSLPSTTSSTSSGLTATPSTPASKPLSSNSPFSAFASTSGFASTKKPSSTGGAGNAFGTPIGGSRSAFSSYSAVPSAFASVPSTPSAKSPLPSSTSTDDVSSVSADPAAEGKEDSGRKMGEPEQPDENRRIYTERETHTGEETDQVVHNVRAKLFAMQEGNWVERGMGPLKVNLTKREGEKDGARIVMRADATHRLLLNSPLFKEFFIEVSNEKYVRFTIIEGSEPISYMARLGNPAAAEALVAAIRERTSSL